MPDRPVDSPRPHDWVIAEREYARQGYGAHHRDRDDVCCESSARDAATLGYRVIMVADANATVFDAWHNATLTTIYRSFGDVRSTSEVLQLLR